MSAPPKTVVKATPQEEAAIRAAVRNADVSKISPACVRAANADVAALVDLLSDPRVSGPIYDLPHPISFESVAEWVKDAEAKSELGECILTITPDDDGRLITYSRFTIWPERSAAEIAGAYRTDVQSAGLGRAGAAASFDWMFSELGVKLICVTAAIDNERSARVIEAAGFKGDGRTRRRPRRWLGPPLSLLGDDTRRIRPPEKLVVITSPTE
jgi:RimJ/RimL family protein N-acetyltransferase